MGYIALAIMAVIGLIIGAALVFFLLKRRSEEGSEKPFLMLQSEMQEMRRLIDQKMGESAREMGASMKAQLSESNKIVREVTEGLTKLGETNRQVVSFAEELRKLQDVLQNPKQRGILGEYYLETVLQNVLPPGGFALQYAFKNGEIVDAAIFVKDKIIPVDSKFSLENYNRLLEATNAGEREQHERAFKQDLKNRIDETSKYVRPNEGTTEFAFMFIPSEGLYYDVLVNKVGTGRINARDMVEYAFSKKVIITSPTSFLAYLQTVLQGLKALQIEESAKEIRKRVEDLGRHLGKYDEYYKKLGTSLGTTVNHYNAAYKELGKIDKDVLRIAETSPGIEAIAIDKPMGNEES